MIDKKHTRNGNLNFDEIGNFKYIKDSDNYYVNDRGEFFKLCKNNKLLKLKPYIHKDNGYVYISINMNNGKRITYRAHIIVAKHFIENHNKDYNIVGHNDNNKTNNNVSNLYWTNIKENTQKAVDDKLLVNDKGIEDSQSKPIAIYSNDGILCGVYGSISEASRYIEGFSKTSISKVVDKSNHGIKGYYFVTITKEEYLNLKEYHYIKIKTKTIKKIISKIRVEYNGIINIYDSQKEASKHIPITQGMISHILNKNIQNYKGYKITRI